MNAHRVVSRGRRLMSVTRLRFPVCCLGMILGVLVPGLAVMAADEHGFVMPPDGGQRVSGPMGRQSGPTHPLPIWGVMPTRE